MRKRGSSLVIGGGDGDVVNGETCGDWLRGVVLDGQLDVLERDTCGGFCS